MKEPVLIETTEFKFTIPREFILGCRERFTIPEKDLLRLIGWHEKLECHITQLRHAKSVVELAILKHSGIKCL